MCASVRALTLTVNLNIGFIMQYSGQILDGHMHGYGKLTYESGDSYEGEWVKGKCRHHSSQLASFSLFYFSFVTICRKETWEREIYIHR